MAKRVGKTDDQPFVKLFRELTYRWTPWEVWQDFVTKSGRTATKSSQNPGGFARSLFLLNTVKYNCQLENIGNYKGSKHNERHEHYR